MRFGFFVPDKTDLGASEIARTQKTDHGSVADPRRKLEAIVPRLPRSHIKAKYAQVIGFLRLVKKAITSPLRDEENRNARASSPFRFASKRFNLQRMTRSISRARSRLTGVKGENRAVAREI